jgi:4-alpha-glucanotransferase
LKQQLLELSRLYGIQTSYLDMTKQRRYADPEALLLVLRAMGAGVNRMDDVAEALRRRKEELRERSVEPVMVAWDGKLGARRLEFGYHEIEVKGHPVFVISAPKKAYFPGECATAAPHPALRATLSQRERDLLPPGGATPSGRERDLLPPDGVTLSRREQDLLPPGGVTLSRREQDLLPPGGATPSGRERDLLPPGGVTLSRRERDLLPPGGVTLSRRERDLLPPGEGGPKGRMRGRWGLFAPAYALHSKRNPYAGDLTDFENFMDWMAGLGGSVAATLPLLGAFFDEPFDSSPYSPATRLFWNEFYVDLERIPEFTIHPGIEPPKKTKFVDYRGVMAYKRRILEELSRKFFSNPAPQRLRAFRRFVRENPGVNDYAAFRAVMDRRRTGWRDWPARLRDGSIRKGDYDEPAKNYHLYSQWIIQEQLQALSEGAAARGQFLYLDLPLGLSSAGYDIWRNRNFFVDGVSGGAPPDPVFTKGQNWGFPPMNPEAVRLNRYQYVIAYLRNHFRYAKLLRIDHVMGLYRLYWIPQGLTGDKGVYVEYPAEELWAILSLESHRSSAGIVGENLGTVPPEVNAAMTKHDIRGMYVAQYELMGNPDKRVLPPPPGKCVASLNTHDMPPFRAFLDGTDIADRQDLGFIDRSTAQKERRQREKMRAALQRMPLIRPFGPPSPGRRRTNAAREKIFLRMLQFLSDSSANIVLVNLEDLWEETLPQNVPATGAERPNWRRRVRPGLEQIRKMTAIAEVLSNVFAQRSRSLSV